jgi:hypothetical protein
MAMKPRTGALLRAGAIAVIVGLGAWYYAPTFGQSGLFAGFAGATLSLAGLVLFEYYGPGRTEEEEEGDED